MNIVNTQKYKKTVYRILLGLCVIGATLGGAHQVLATRLDNAVFDNIVNQEINKDSSLTTLNSDIEQKAKQVRDIEEKLKIYKDNLEKKQQEKFSLQQEISTIETRIDSAQADIGKNQTEIDILGLELQVLEKQITVAENDIERQKAILKGVIKELYLRDKQSPFEIAMQSTNLSDFYSEAEYTSRIQKEMQETVDAVQKNKDDLNQKKTELAEKKSGVAKETADLQTKKDQLEGDQAYKGQLLDQTKQSEEEFQKLVSQAKSDQAQMEGQISGLQTQAQSKISKIKAEIQARLSDGDKTNDTLTTEEEAITESKTGFIWPIPSRTITCGFHCGGYPFQNYIGPHSGMDIATPVGTPIRAAAAGYVARVVFDPGSSRLGWIMIVHGDGLATVYMHVSGVNVTADQFVAQGQVIGRSGGLAGTPGSGLSTGAHLHFEVRLNGIPTNPASYLP